MSHLGAALIAAHDYILSTELGHPTDAAEIALDVALVAGGFMRADDSIEQIALRRESGSVVGLDIDTSTGGEIAVSLHRRTVSCC